MATEPKRPEHTATRPEPTEPGYEAWLTREIVEGLAELLAGQGVPAEGVWSDLGAE